jgi:hypothetical protein
LAFTPLRKAFWKAKPRRLALQEEEFSFGEIEIKQEFFWNLIALYRKCAEKYSRILILEFEIDFTCHSTHAFKETSVSFTKFVATSGRDHSAVTVRFTYDAVPFRMF